MKTNVSRPHSHPSFSKQSHSQAHATGFTLLEIMVVVALIAMMVAVAVPTYVHARAQSQSRVCINNLRLIDQAKQQVLLADPGAPLSKELLRPHIGRGEGSFPACPLSPNDGGDSYVIGGPDEKPSCNNVSLLPHVLP